MQKRQGVSLIVLVITIIVMTILAGAIILTLNNSGIINKATDAVEQSNLATVKELTQMAWAEAYAGGERTEEGLKTAVDKALSDNKVDTSKYAVEVTTSGVTVELKVPKKGWVQQGLTVTNGETTLEIGDSIAYDETNGGTITGLTATDWAVLGASDEGELLIVTTNDIGPSIVLSDGEDYELGLGQGDWLHTPDRLDGICEKYGKGVGAISARSITVEDINRVTGYNPEKAGYGKGTISEYGIDITYSYNGTTSLAYSTSSGLTGTTSEHSRGFYYPDGDEFVVVEDLITGTKGTSIVTLKNSGYYYGLEDFVNIDENSKAYTALFDDPDNTYYWVASRSIQAGIFGMFMVEGDGIDWRIMCCTEGGHLSDVYGGRSRAVVTLSPDIQLIGSSEMGWNIE